jgi:hypothetical protein
MFMRGGSCGLTWQLKAACHCGDASSAGYAALPAREIRPMAYAEQGDPFALRYRRARHEGFDKLSPNGVVENRLDLSPNGAVEDRSP